MTNEKHRQTVWEVSSKKSSFLFDTKKSALLFIDSARNEYKISARTIWEERDARV